MMDAFSSEPISGGSGFAISATMSRFLMRFCLLQSFQAMAVQLVGMRRQQRVRFPEGPHYTNGDKA